MIGSSIYRNYKVESSGRYWSDEVSARSNQDNQREYEERAMKRIEMTLDRKFDTLSKNFTSTIPSLNPGIYVRLENERRERQRQQKNRSKI